MRKELKKTSRKAERGITLVALVITVIVLLILAGATVTIALQGGDLFEHSNNAVNKWNEGVRIENETYENLMTDAEDYLSEYDS